ncbi:uncharacterized protein LOC101210823 isoform X2 [Cucumis sativus]|uniref:uncharacterized protein LOC101210823 isoform X2 n=1 Tax=Cucumis sativus TaxID=3659 RepID=UPI0012F4EDCE|nr:uncharacterized protein LOC101210823 isoform X2 [Cucumis sativus]KGN60315.2 hypothetical protein Csa_001155 [Cucumis sativus]
MSQLQKSLSLASSSSNAISSSVFSTAFSAFSSSRLRHFTTKLQGSTLQNYTSKYTPVLPFSTACNSARCSQLVFRKGGVTFAVTTERTKAGQYRACDGPSVFTLYSRLPLRFPHSAALPNASNQQLLNGIFAHKLPNYRAFGRKFFSNTTEALNGTKKKNVKYARKGTSTFPIEGSNKKLKGEKPVATSRKKRISASKASGSTYVGETNSSDQLVGAMKEANLVSSSSSTRKASKGLNEKKSRSKKKKEAISSTNDADVKAVCKDGQSKSFGSSNTDQDVVQDPKKNVTGGTSKDSASTKKKSNKQKRSSSRKKEATKSANKLRQKPHVVVDARGTSQVRTTFKQLYPPMGKSVVIVESVAKAKVIQNYLGDMFVVLPSHGHVRDLAARSGSVRPDDDFIMVWEVPSAAWTHLKSIELSLNGAENLILASDPDQEGEAIAWHIIEMLQHQNSLHEGISIARVVFHEITEASIKSALQSPRVIDENLVQAYLARRALDYLIGFNISPLLWKKLPGCRSPGRVQSAALALICDRETEIDEFHAQEYWTIDIKLNQKNPCSSVGDFAVPAHLTHFDFKKLNQLAISSNMEAKNIETALKSVNFQVLSSKKSIVQTNPPMPYITSTLQQDAANKFNFPASYTMQLAQKLYEGIQLADGKAAGLITYPRTDGLHISDEAVKDIHSLIMQRYGQDFVSKSGHKYFKKVNKAQEADEAIRPTDVQLLPSMLVGILDEDSHKLYSLIWLRTMACQMEPSISEQIEIDCGLTDESIVSGSTCSRVQFRGFQDIFEDPEVHAVKHENHEESGQDELFRILNALKPGDQLSLLAVELKQHFTQPPPRYSEGTLVKRMEELGIGRPSTYATTIKVLQDRNYVSVKSCVLHPEFRGRIVSAFLCHHFSEVSNCSSTADIENKLDNVSAGLTEWKGFLRDCWTQISSYCKRANNVNVNQVEKMLEKKYGDFLFSFLPDNSRACPSCPDGTLCFKVSRFGVGYYIGCDQHPSCKYVAKTLFGEDEDKDKDPSEIDNGGVEPKVLGLHPVLKEKVLLKTGPFGCYIQLGEDRKGYMPKRASVFEIKDVNSITLDFAIDRLRYPITLGKHPKDGQPVIIKIARTGFTIRHGRTIASIPKNLKPNNVDLAKALKLLSSSGVRRVGRPKGLLPKVEDDFY